MGPTSKPRILAQFGHPKFTMEPMEPQVRLKGPFQPMANRD